MLLQQERHDECLDSADLEVLNMDARQNTQQAFAAALQDFDGPAWFLQVPKQANWKL